MDELIKILTRKKLSISSCESFTVGNFGARLGSVSGASLVYKGSLICYNTSIKVNVLKVNQETVERYGVVSKEVANEMCINGAKLFDSDICVSFTGNAGPSAMENKPVGLIYIGINFMGKIEVIECHLNGTRHENVNEAIEIALKKLLEKVE